MKTLNFYELVYIARPELSSDQVDTLNSEISTTVTNSGGKISKIENWGVRNLAYKIKKRHKGIYCLLNLTCESTAIDSIRSQSKHNVSFLRMLIIKVDILEDGPSSIMKRKNKTDDYHKMNKDKASDFIGKSDDFNGKLSDFTDKNDDQAE